MKKLKFIIYVLLGVIIIFLGIKEYKQSKILDDYPTKKSLGFFIKYRPAVVHSQQESLIYYWVDNKKRILKNHLNLDFMKLGDTLLIEYSTKDKDIARVIDKYYMMKYKKLRKK